MPKSYTRALENPSYDSWRLRGPDEYDLPLRICKCGAECSQDAWECEECEEKAWQELDAEELSLPEVVQRQDERQAELEAGDESRDFV